MQQLAQYFSQLIDENVHKLIISKPRKKDELYKKIVIERKEKYYQIAKYTDKQVFHENIDFSAIADRCMEITEGHYAQVNAWSSELEFYILISIIMEFYYVL